MEQFPSDNRSQNDNAIRESYQEPLFEADQATEDVYDNSTPVSPNSSLVDNQSAEEERAKLERELDAFNTKLEEYADKRGISYRMAEACLAADGIVSPEPKIAVLNRREYDQINRTGAEKARLELYQAQREKILADNNLSESEKDKEIAYLEAYRQKGIEKRKKGKYNF